ncbi:sensor histidine kinase [Paraburkholderia largidicola]|uniref:histidine kinase n=1 Tax=Paraburkholderia largidicola TaxID=3014751 RepID=A0A7I8C289_9BURK|nr:sensor histidine kinase [Paraburkholderia sp. PGU16]BCF94943.1 hypothetical protein PPGU16_80100 [Paraburkholderia sp. PGU16]
MATAKEKELDKGQLAFRAEARLLQELGERLVAQPEVALVELIKNSYDADATECRVAFSADQKALCVCDDGHGMTKEEFESRWMTIATSKKAIDRTSRKYQRDLTGQKGIGRFAVRFLGTSLQVISVAEDAKRGCLTKLVADFDWQKIDENDSLVDTEVPYRLFKAGPDDKEGTTLRISGLRRGGEFASGPSFRSGVLKIVSPISGLDRGRFKRAKSRADRDPGFRVALPGEDDSSTINVAEYVLENAWARLAIDLKNNALEYKVSFSQEDFEYQLQLDYPSAIAAGLHADIRFFPRRAGLFADKGVDGRTAYTWVKENSGVVVVDRGFRVKPYGDVDDDWLSLDRDSARHVRDWRTSIAEVAFPMSTRQKAEPALNPMLNLPANHQLIGAVFVRSASVQAVSSIEDIIPSTDREGFLRTQGFEQLTEIIRGGIEFLAHIDKQRQLEEQERAAKQAAKQIKADFKAAIEFVQNVPTLSVAERSRLVKDYSTLSRRIEEVEEYDREARRKLEVMGSLGVVAGFLTHEASRIVTTVHDAVSLLTALSDTHQELQPHVEILTESYDALKAHLEYTKLFVDAAHSFKAVSFKCAPQVKRIAEKFGKFAHDHGVEIKIEISPDVQVPAMPITIYSGIILNLYTNALKAVIAAETPSYVAEICFRAWTAANQHVIEVLDTGVGIPENLASRIWDPLFTTTSRLNNPLGSGMGLGLSLVKQLVEQVRGKIALVEAPAPYSTCFRVSFPLSEKK